MKVVMTEMDKIREAAAYLQCKVSDKIHVGVVLGSGLGSFTEEIAIKAKCTGDLKFVKERGKVIIYVPKEDN
jgi:purine nucleoside phosphorylase